MSIPLTAAQEPGFFSAVSVSPSLFLIPGSTQVVGIIGEGSPTKTITEGLTRGLADYNALANPLSKIDLIASNSVFRFPQSSYSAAMVGTSDLSMLLYPIGAGSVDGLTLITQVDGQIAETVTFAAPANAAAIVSQINAAMVNVHAELSSSNRLVLWVSNSNFAAFSFAIGAGTADTLLGLSNSQRAQAVRWNPLVTYSDFAPQPGDSYNVTYETPKLAADFAPVPYFGLSQVVAAYGDLSPSGSLYSITAGAQAAFGNGASIIIVRQLNPAQMSTSSNKQGEIVAALSDMGNQKVSVLVPMIALNDATLAFNMGPTYLNHVSKMSSLLERQERIVLLGMDETAGRLPTLGSANSWQSYALSVQPPLSSGLSPKRVMLLNPGSDTVLYKGNSYVANGTYSAACLAGAMVNANVDQAESMTRKPLSTINGLILPDLSRVEKNQLTSMGITVVESHNQTILVRRAVTMDGSSIANQEPSIVRAFDLVAHDVRSGLENRFIGTKILNTTHTAIEAATTTFLEQLVADNIISSYRNIKAVQDKTEPRQFDVSFECVPIFPFLWGFVDLSIVLS